MNSDRLYDWLTARRKWFVTTGAVLIIASVFTASFKYVSDQNHAPVPPLPSQGYTGSKEQGVKSRLPVVTRPSARRLTATETAQPTVIPVTSPEAAVTARSRPTVTISPPVHHTVTDTTTATATVTTPAPTTPAPKSASPSTSP